jgi:hypothetical protein
MKYVAALAFVAFTLSVSAVAAFIHAGTYEGSEYFYE